MKNEFKCRKHIDFMKWGNFTRSDTRLRVSRQLAMLARAADKIDLTIAGDLEDVEINFGVKTHRSNPPRFHSIAPERQFLLKESGFSPQNSNKKIGRNEPCPCGSGKKYKKCCRNKL